MNLRRSHPSCGEQLTACWARRPSSGVIALSILAVLLHRGCRGGGREKGAFTRRTRRGAAPQHPGDNSGSGGVGCHSSVNASKDAVLFLQDVLEAQEKCLNERALQRATAE